MRVIKRSGEDVEMLFDKVTSRIRKLNMAPEFEVLHVQPDKVAQKVFSSMYDGISTAEIDTLSAEVSISMITEHPDYETLAMRITVSNLQKNCPKTFSDCAVALYNKNLVSEEFIKNVKLEMDSWIVQKRDYDFGYFGIKTLQRGYLLPGETPQYMFMRVALGIHGEDLRRVRETYNLMSQKYFTHATPTLFNAGTNRPQMSSCFLVATKDDSIDGIYDTLKECAQISKWSGGIGLHISNVRANGTKIQGTNGVSDGIIPMLRVFNNTARYVNQGGGKRKGSFAVYLEPWHADIMEFLDLRLNQGDEEARCRDLFTALWVPDLFMQKVEEDGDWYLMCPNESPKLQNVYGEEFNEMYRTYVAQGRYKRKVRAREVWDKILKSQVETGTPYMCYKDSVNTKSNQKNIGTIKSSNLCTEIMEVSGENETAVCNLASICLPTFLKENVRMTAPDGTHPYTFDYDKLDEVTRVVTRNLNRIIDKNYYPTRPAELSNMRHRPIGIGVQGLADVFMMMGIPFDSPFACQLNKNIFTHIYFAALAESCWIAKDEGAYETFRGSPASEGILQFDMWGVKPYFDFGLEKHIKEYGLRNSLLIAPMPTASTSQIMGNNECFEPYTTNIYLRRTLAGEFVVVNKHLIRDLQKLNMWSPEMKTEIIRNGGSIQNIQGIPDDIKAIYRTVWEIPQKSIIDMAADRGPYIDQSQSLNIFMEDPSLAKLTSMHFYGWKKGLKTGMYYLRTRPKAKPIQVTVPVGPQVPLSSQNPTEEQINACRLDNPEGCLMCSA
jgi:ribonucleoside-diphosphate reductase alpha subunit